MTLPFENDTSGIIKRISTKSLNSNRKRNIFTILTIALASALLSAIVLYGFGVSQKTENDNIHISFLYHNVKYSRNGTNNRVQPRLYIMLFPNNKGKSCIIKMKLRG